MGVFHGHYLHFSVFGFMTKCGKKNHFEYLDKARHCKWYVSLGFCPDPKHLMYLTFLMDILHF